jgi:diacylglycerol kinase
MFALVPLDVWIAAVAAAAAGLMAIFGPSAGVFILIYVSLCVYIVVEIINDEIAG